ncbi:MAG: hypothetical protein V7637_4870 [Mycobacteriales bacterium]
MTATRDAIAVVGMACRLPGAADTRRYWSALRSGAETITRFEPDRLVAGGADPHQVRHPDFVPARGVLADSYAFDWQHFGYSRAEAAAIDPQQRVFLECAAAAVDDAGIDPTRFAGRIGVYAGADKVPARGGAELSELAEAIGTEKDFLASRVSYKLGLRGPAVTVQTACSTSLTSVHLAAQSLRWHDCDAALAGGVTVLPRGDVGYRYERGGILSRDGHCRPFDQHSDGTVPSEGAGVVMLKRAADALRDGDRILALIVGSAINNDGSEKIGYTAPSIAGQSEAIRHAHRVAGVDAADIGYVEAHGTGTRLGDPIEVQALAEVFGPAGRPGGPCWLGAVKSNIGHTGAAAGVAGLIKTALMYEHRELVPTLHYTGPNPLLELESTPFEVCTSHARWPDRPGGEAPLAAVSSFGLGGTNAHVVLAGPPRPGSRVGRPGPRVLALSAAAPDALARMRRRLADHLADEIANEIADDFAEHLVDEIAERRPEEPVERAAAEPAAPAGGAAADVSALTLPAVATTLAARRRLAHRQAFVADGLPEAVLLMRDAPDPGAPGSLRRVAFLFPGQGTLRSPAGAVPYRLLPGFRDSFDEIRAAAAAGGGPDLTPVVTGGTAPDGWFRDTVHQQLGLFALGWALARQLGDWGVRPAVMLGNSIGEYVAATLAGTWTVPDAVQLVRQRAAAMRDTAPGLMASVAAPAAEVRGRIGSAGAVTVAVATPGAAVVSGPREAMADLLAGDALRGLDVRELDVQRAFHSVTMEPAAEVLRAAVAAVPSRRPTGRVISNSTGDHADPDLLRTPDYWATHLRRAVLLDDSITTLLRSNCDTFIELGPGTSMLAAVRRGTGWDPDHTTVPMLGRAGDEEHGLLRALGALWERGADRALDAIDEPAAGRAALPPYPFAGEEPDAAPAPVRTPAAPSRAPRPGSLRAAIEGCWCAALGVRSAAPGDDFFALGGESLTAVDLLGRIQRETGVAVSVTEFSQDRTFAGLLRLAEQESAGHMRPLVRAVALNGGGRGRPLFLAADAAGNALSYRALAAELAGVRPVIGLEPIDAATAGLPIERSAVHHLAAVRAVQPEGPYTIGGWSYGAMIAHEMAHQLTAAGTRVDALVQLDAYLPGRAGRPIGLDPGFLASALWLQVSATVHIGPAGRRPRQDPALRRLLLDKARVLARYRPRQVDCPAVVVKAGLTPGVAARLRSRLAGLYGGGVRVIPADGDHWTMLAPPHVPGLARGLREALPGNPDRTE